jgi:hypothetical protein
MKCYFDKQEILTKARINCILELIEGQESHKDRYSFLMM